MIEINNTTKQSLDERAFHYIIKEFLRFFKKLDHSVSVAVIGAARMKSLNNHYRGVNKTTDVLSFPGNSAPVGGRRRTLEKPAGLSQGGKYLGEILLNISEVKKTSQYLGLLKEIQVFTGRNKPAGLKVNLKPNLKSSLRSGASNKARQYLVYFLLVHGLLHLIGQDDHSVSGRRRMIRQGQKFLSLLGYEPPVLPKASRP